MKKRVLLTEMIIGIIVLLGGLLTYGLGIYELLPVPRPDLVLIGTTLIGILLIIDGSFDLFSKKSKEQEIEEKDERNIAISNAAMASAFKVMTTALSLALLALIFMGYLSEVSFLTIIGVFFLGQGVYVVRLWRLQKNM